MTVASPFRGRLGIARAGYGQIARAMLLAAMLALATAPMVDFLCLGWLSLPAFVLWFFRDPERVVPPGEELLLAPADGTVDDVESVDRCPFFEGPALRIGIYMSLLSVHVQRAPLSARVIASIARAGRRVATHRVGELDDNEQHVTVFAPRSAPETQVAVRQIAGPIARGIVNLLEPGQDIERGARFGLIRFGSRVEVFIAQDLHPSLRVGRGARVRAGSTVLADCAPVANAAPVATSGSATTRIA